MDCLHTKLKASISGDALPKLGEARFPVSAGTKMLRIYVESTSSQVMGGADGLEIASGGGAYGAANFIAAAVSGLLCVPDKDKVSLFQSYDTLSSTEPTRLAIEDSSVFKYMTALRQLSVVYKYLNVQDFGTQSMIQIGLYPYDFNSKIVGTLAQLTSHMVNHFSACSIHLEGDLSEFSGNLNALEDLPNCNFNVDYSADLSGSLHYLGTKTFIATFIKNAMSYTGTRPNGSYFLSTGGDGIKFASITDVQNFVIDNATLDFSPTATASPTIYNRLYIFCEGVTYDDLSAAAKTAITNIKARDFGGEHIVVKLNGSEI